MELGQFYAEYFNNINELAANPMTLYIACDRFYGQGTQYKISPILMPT
jgi:hypothetical protein